MGWDYFFCEIEGEAAVMAVDRSLEAPQQARPYLVYMRVYKSPWLKVELEPGEDARLFEGIEAYVERIAALFDAVYAGRSSTAEARVYVFYDGEGRYLQRWLERSFKSLGDYGYERSIGWGRDPEWKVYRDFLLPGPKECEAITMRALQA